MTKRSESTALAATAKNWTRARSRATNTSSTPALGARPEGSRLLPRAFALFGYGAVVLPRHIGRVHFSATATRTGFPRFYAVTDSWLEDLGMTVGATVVKAMHDDAFAHAFCIATDATGVLVQPIASGDQGRRACRRGHYFVQIADADHVFFGAPAKPARCHE